MNHHVDHTLEKDIALAKEWSKPEFLPPDQEPGKGNGWRHTCYRLAKYIEDHIQTPEAPSKNPGSHIGFDLANHKSESKTVVTCVYCGHQYPEGTPQSQSSELTNHIKVCDRHPMREAEATIDMLRLSLSNLVGASETKDLNAMEVGIKTIPGQDPESVKVAIQAIKTLIHCNKREGR